MRIIDTPGLQPHHKKYIEHHCHSDPPKLRTRILFYILLLVWISVGTCLWIHAIQPQSLPSIAMNFTRFGVLAYMLFAWVGAGATWFILVVLALGTPPAGRGPRTPQEAMRTHTLLKATLKLFAPRTPLQRVEKGLVRLNFAFITAGMVLDGYTLVPILTFIGFAVMWVACGFIRSGTTLTIKLLDEGDVAFMEVADAMQGCVIAEPPPVGSNGHGHVSAFGVSGKQRAPHKEEGT